MKHGRSECLLSGILDVSCVSIIAFVIWLEWRFTVPSSINNEPVALPVTEEAQMAELRRLVQQGSAKLVGPDGHQIELPATVHDLLLSILKNLEAGKAISIVPEHQQLTTQRAANLVGVSRPFLVGLLENGEIPFHMVGS